MAWRISTLRPALPRVLHRIVESKATLELWNCRRPFGQSGAGFFGIMRYRRNSGEISRGRISGISGQTMIAASTSSIGTSMISVSFSA